MSVPAVREVTMTCVHLHGSNVFDCLLDLVAMRNDERIQNLVPMSLWFSEPTEPCSEEDDTVEYCVTLLLAHPGTGRML